MKHALQQTESENTSRLNRRQFLNHGLTLGAGLTLAPWVSRAATSASQTTQTEPKGFFTLGQPIVGVICVGQHLLESDATFGVPSVFYPAKAGQRGLEPGQYFQQFIAKSGMPDGFKPDEVILSQDRSTLSIKATAYPESGYFDQVRVITLAPDQE